MRNENTQILCESMGSIEREEDMFVSPGTSGMYNNSENTLKVQHKTCQNEQHPDRIKLVLDKKEELDLEDRKLRVFQLHKTQILKYIKDQSNIEGRLQRRARITAG